MNAVGTGVRQLAKVSSTFSLSCYEAVGVATGRPFVPKFSRLEQWRKQLTKKAQADNPRSPWKWRLNACYCVQRLSVLC